jgi:hypothetical protein
LPPHVQKNVAQEVFGQGLITHESQEPAIERDAMPAEKRSHRQLVAAGDPSDQHFVG